MILQNDGLYEAILKEHANQTSIAVNQIELDLLRTLPTNKYYDKPDAQGVNDTTCTYTCIQHYTSLIPRPFSNRKQRWTLGTRLTLQYTIHSTVEYQTTIHYMYTCTCKHMCVCK